MKIGKFDVTAVDQGEVTDAGASEIKGGGTTQSAYADHQYSRRGEFGLTGCTDFWERGLARMVSCERRIRRGLSRAVHPFGGAIGVMLFFPYWQAALNFLDDMATSGKPCGPMRGSDANPDGYFADAQRAGAVDAMDLRAGVKLLCFGDDGFTFSLSERIKRFVF